MAGGRGVSGLVDGLGGKVRDALGLCFSFLLFFGVIHGLFLAYLCSLWTARICDVALSGAESQCWS